MHIVTRLRHEHNGLPVHCSRLLIHITNLLLRLTIAHTLRWNGLHPGVLLLLVLRVRRHDRHLNVVWRRRAVRIGLRL